MERVMSMKYYRNATHIDMLKRDYEEEIIKVKKMLETEEDLRTRSILQEGLAENIESLKHLEEFIENNPGLFK